MSSLFDIGISGLSAAKNAMYLTGNNIANANNPFYSRRVVDFLPSGHGIYGGGVTLGDVRRISNSFAEKQLLNATNDSSKTALFYNNLKNLESFIDNDQTSVTQFINSAMNALETLNSNSTSVQGRSFYLDKLQAMSNRINSVSNRFSEEFTDSKNAIGQKVSQANQILKQLSEINQKIKLQDPNNALDLKDQKEQLLNNLSQLMEFNSQDDSYGGVHIALKNGLPLLEGVQIATFNVTDSKGGSGLDITLEHSGHTSIITDSFNTGEISGLLDYNNNNLNALQKKLDSLAVSFSFIMNAQNHLGIDAQGRLGGDIFTDFNASSVAQNRIKANPLNQGSAQMSAMITDPGKLYESDYQLNFDTSSHYTLVRKSDGTTVSEGTLGSFPAEIAGEGFAITIDNGTFNAGDNFSVTPTKGAASQLQVTASSGSQLALGLPIVTTPNLENIGSGQIHLTKVIDTSNSAFSVPMQLNPPVKIEMISANTYRLLNANDNTVIEDNIPYDPQNGADIFPTPGGYDPGYRVQLSGLMQAGDKFSIEYNVSGSGDNRNGLLLSELYSKGLLQSNQFTFAQAYQDLIFGLSSATNSAKANSEADGLFRDQMQKIRDETSAISLDEEIMDLKRLEQSFLANAQVLEAAKQTMDSIFSLFRG